MSNGRPIRVIPTMEYVTLRAGAATLYIENEEAELLARVIRRTLAGEPETPEEEYTRLQGVGVYDTIFRVHTLFPLSDDDGWLYVLNVGGWGFEFERPELETFADELIAAVEENGRLLADGPPVSSTEAPVDWQAHGF